MKYFLIEGTVINPKNMTEQILQEHKKYIGMLMKEKKILFSALKTGTNSSVTVVKAETKEFIEDFYSKEPFLMNNIIKYSISELNVHYNVSSAEDWFKN